MTSLSDLLPATLITIVCFVGSLYSLRAVRRDRTVTVIGRGCRRPFAEGSTRYSFYVGCVKGLIALSGLASVFMVAVDCIMLL